MKTWSKCYLRNGGRRLRRPNGKEVIDDRVKAGITEGLKPMQVDLQKFKQRLRAKDTGGRSGQPSEPISNDQNKSVRFADSSKEKENSPLRPTTPKPNRGRRRRRRKRKRIPEMEIAPHHTTKGASPAPRGASQGFQVEVIHDETHGGQD